MLLWSINVKISVATINLLLRQKLAWEFLHFWHFYVWKSFRISCLSVCSDPFIGKAFHAAPTVFVSQSLYAESIEVLLLQRTRKVFMYKSRGKSSLFTIQCYFFAYFDQKKCNSKQIFLVQMLKCAETLIFYLFCPWKYEKNTFKSRILKQNWRNFPLLPWLPKITNPFYKFGYSTISLCISDWNLLISNMIYDYNWTKEILI